MRQTLFSVTFLLTGSVIVLALLHAACAAPLSNDVDQMEEMEVLGLVGCNHAVTVTALPPPAFTTDNNHKPRQQSNDSDPSAESGESSSASKESPNAGQEKQTENR
uniref:Secreted protein n=1 Tax=Anopheles farauti TaxID=69004 RepID=A0A182Q8W8_9DIPT